MWGHELTKKKTTPLDTSKKRGTAFAILAIFLVNILSSATVDLSPVAAYNIHEAIFLETRIRND